MVVYCWVYHNTVEFNSGQQPGTFQKKTVTDESGQRRPTLLLLHRSSCDEKYDELSIFEQITLW